MQYANQFIFLNISSTHPLYSCYTLQVYTYKAVYSVYFSKHWDYQREEQSLLLLLKKDGTKMETEKEIKCTEEIQTNSSEDPNDET